MKFNVILRASVGGTQKTSGSYLLMEVVTWLEENKSRTFCESINRVLFLSRKCLRFTSISFSNFSISFRLSKYKVINFPFWTSLTEVASWILRYYDELFFTIFPF